MNTEQLHHQLKKQFGFDGFREGQQQTIESLLAGHSSLAIFPTGAGKSLCYQFTALQLPHLTLVISPLLALMKDQLDFLKSKNIHAASIDSTLSPEQSKQVMADAKSGKLKILMVSVERFKNERFRNFIQQVAVSMLVVDEAHCISEWGHNFRPDYLKIPHYLQNLNGGSHVDSPRVLLLTATATRKVKLDMADKFNIASQNIVQTGFYRRNLDLQMLPAKPDGKDTQLLTIIRQQSGAGIVYVTLQQTAEQLARKLSDSGINALAYHAGLKDENRQSIQHHFMSGNVDIVVATIAFGMGIDKSDIRFVIHYDLPKSIENYSQEIGRAGRDGEPSKCVVLADLNGLNTLENFIYGDTPLQSSIEVILQQMKTAAENHPQALWELQLYDLSQVSNIRQLPLKTLLVQLELLDIIKAKYSYFAEYRIKCLEDQATIINKFNGERQSFIHAVFAATSYKKVWGIVDFDALNQAYPSDRSRVLTALEYLQTQGLIELKASNMTEVYEVNMARIAQESIASQLRDYFAAKETSEIKRIAALIEFIQQDNCSSHNLASYFDDNQAPVQCGHCSVCRGYVASLPAPELPSPPTEQLLKNYVTELQERLEMPQISADLATRFLCGLTQPVFTKAKAKQLSGWASCEPYRYGEIREICEGLLA